MKVSKLFVLAAAAGYALSGCHQRLTAPSSDPARSVTSVQERAPNAETSRFSRDPVPLSPTAAEPPIDRSTCGLPAEIREPTWPRTLAPTTKSEPHPPQAGTTTIAVLPDTQYYTSCSERHFLEQSNWIAGQVEKRNIVATIHLGDLTEHNIPTEWDYVRNALTPLFDKVPLILATGNHDYGPGGNAEKRTTLFADYFGAPTPKTVPTVAQVMKPGTVENAYYRLRLPGVTLGVLVLEWSPTNAAVDWAKRAVAAYPYDRKIFITHAYLYHDGTRYDFAKKGDEQPWNPLSYGTAKIDPALPYSKSNANAEGSHDGEMLWQELLADMSGLFLTINGHVLGDGAGVLTSAGHRGDKVHQMLTNYQMLDEGGLGYLRLIEIAPDGATMQMKTYSPSLETFAMGADQHFVLPIEPPLF